MPRLRHAALLFMGLSVFFSSGAEARTLAEIQGSGELRICVAGSSAPFYQGNGEEFARFLKVKAVVKPLADWDEQFRNAGGVTVKEAHYEAARLSDGSCDLFPNDLHMTDWRRTKMLLVPYYKTRMMVVANSRQRQTLKRPSDLSGLKAAVQKGTAYENWLNQQNRTVFSTNPVAIELLPTADSMKRVAEGDADFTIIGAEAAFKWVRGDLGKLDLLFPVDEAVEVGWGISPRAADLGKQLELFFTENKRVGSGLDRSWQRQYGISLMEYQLFESSFKSGGLDLKVILSWALPVGSGVLGVLGAVLFWNRRLKREIQERTRTEAALRESRETIERESARRLAISRMSLRLQQVASIAEFGQVLLSELSSVIPIGQALFCPMEQETEQLRAVAHYAGDGASPAESLERFSVNGGLIDRCIATGQPVLIDNPPAEYLRIRSGLGSCTAAAILVFPIMQAGRLCAILELATLQPLDDGHLQLLADLAPLIALSLDNHNQSRRWS